MDKSQLISRLKSVYVELRPSPVHGIGVFAVRKIPRGCRDAFSTDKGEWIKLPKKDVIKLPGYSRKLIYNFCTYDSQFYYVEDAAFKKYDLANFINHSDLPNIISVEKGKYFEALVNISRGEELFIDYNNL